jgi:hypothetical protein
VKNFYADLDARLSALPFICRRSFFGGRHHRLGDRRFRRQSNELSVPRRAQSAETLG